MLGDGIKPGTSRLGVVQLCLDEDEIVFVGAPALAHCAGRRAIAAATGDADGCDVLPRDAADLLIGALRDEDAVVAKDRPPPRLGARYAAAFACGPKRA